MEAQNLEVHGLKATDIVANNLEDLSKYAPRKGSRVMHRDQLYGIVSRVDGNVCHVEGGRGENTLFIWRFRDNPATGRPAHLNRLFSWPEKVSA